MTDYLADEKQFLQTLEKHIRETEAIDIQLLARPDIPYGYADALPLFELIKKQIVDVKALNLSCVPANALHEAGLAIEEANRLFLAIMNVVPPSDDEKTKRNISFVLTHWRDTLTTEISNLFLLSLSPSSIQSTANELKQLREGLATATMSATATTEKNQEFLGDSEAAFNGILKLVQSKLDELKAALAGLGTAEYMLRFENEAKEHKDTAQNWLYAVFAFGWYILVAAFYFVWSDAHTTPAFLKHGVPGVITSTSTRLLLMSVLSVGLFLSLRNYSACRHNYIVNRHRINALGTFEFFRSGAPDDETKKAVLLQSMQAIFAPQSTGYLKTASEPQQNTHIIELIQSTLTKGGGTHV